MTEWDDENILWWIILFPFAAIFWVLASCAIYEIIRYTFYRAV